MDLQNPIQFVDLQAQQRKISPNLMDRIQKVLAHGKYIMGPEIKELEERLAAYVGVKHAITCSSGTDALLMPLMAYGARSGDAIFTTPFTFIATAEVIQLLGATPVFVDIDPKTFNLDPEALAKILIDLNRNPKTANLRPKGIIPVDLFGQPADYDAINSLAKQYGLFVIEDAAQSFGATYKDKRSCALAEVAATSFFPAKPLGGYGDGGAVFTDNDDLASTLRSIRVHGQGTHKYDNVRIGINGRLDTLQAAILLAKFEVFPEEVELRQQVADKYTQLLSSCSLLQTPRVPDGCKSAWAQYSVLTENGVKRSALQDNLKKNGVPTAVYYPKPLHQQTAYAYLRHKSGDFPVSEGISERIFSLPMHPYLEPAEQEKIAAVINND